MNIMNCVNCVNIMFQFLIGISNINIGDIAKADGTSFNSL